MTELQELYEEESIRVSEKAYENWGRRFFEPEGAVVEDVEAKDVGTESAEEKFISLDELSLNDEIADILDPSESNEVVSIFPGEVLFDKEEVRHLDWDFVNGVYVLPIQSGAFEIKVKILCNEMPKPKEETIKVVID